MWNSIFVTLSLLGTIAGLFYVYMIWNFGYWRKRGIKEAKSSFFVGSLPNQFKQRRNFIYDIHDIYKKYKNTENFVGFINCRTPQLLILNAEYAHKVFVNNFKSFHDNEFSKLMGLGTKEDNIFVHNPFVLTGDLWKERRAEVTPGLTANRVSSVYPVTLEVCKTLTDYIKTQLKMVGKDGFDGKELSLRYTTDVVSDCVLGIKAQSLTDNPTPIYSMIQKAFKGTNAFLLYAAIATIFPQITNFYVVHFFPKAVEKFLMELMQTAIDLRRKMPDASKRADFLNYILQLQDKKNLTTADLTSHTSTFLSDGFETTSLVLSHTLLLLGRDQKAQERARAECGTEPLSFDELNDLPYLDACIHETMRIFPASLAARKICTEPFEFVNKDGTTLKVHPGTTVWVPTHSLHHDPEIYENPEDFKPEHFLEENGGVKKYQNMGAYYGFGDGPRICLGMRFALTQIKAALVAILREFNVKVNPKTRKDNKLDDVYFMALLKGGIYLDFERRH